MIKRLLPLPLKWFLYCLSFCFIKNKQLWVFGSRNGQFVDNPKYFFLHTTQHNPDIKSVWISSDLSTVKLLKNQGFTAYSRWSLKGLLTSLRASVFIYAFDSNDINFFCSGGAKLVNLYHGIPLKKIEFNTTVGTSKKVYHPITLVEKLRSKILYAPKWQKIDLFQIPSLSLKSIHDGAFNHLIESYFIGANPRLAPLQNNEVQHTIIENDRITGQSFVKGYDSVWIYMPTWRVGAPDILSEAFPDLDELNKVLKQHNILLIFKMHLYSDDVIKNYSHIKLFPSNLDVYPFLNIVDVLITDYSSIAFDFDINNKKTLFYAYDLDTYLTTSSDGFYFDYQTFCNQKIILNFKELLVVITENDMENRTLGKQISQELWSNKKTISFTDTNNELVNSIKDLWKQK
ncbi:CDP-glycerol glycerophosphotransferase family protein [Pseudoalteromonas sp. C2R02]|uniref:CDP-glycerol glycerophosphotransferase family protein n=1 Tax=Pseudoalteromonas sp. C2R02 TaxID=2841565 RepID=UPI001C09AA0F|nr:CDP-glycerol glycerophosphotransferase family protein [Pseudoalteromonas sp. C2R02]MBU2972625.1 CDP-glycerol glycerophosphotransferase family protein [Pseudoalteromonas sp. C2R02]